MFLGNSDIELLRLAAWCKNLPSDMAGHINSQMLEPARIKLLDQAGLMMKSKNGQCLRLRELGWDFLRYYGIGYHQDTSYREYDRRVESARILLTFWRAGFDVFGSSLSDMDAARVYVPSMAARRGAAKAGDIWGGAAFWGLGRLGNTVVSCYYVTGHEKTLFNYRSEKTLLDKAAAVLGTKAAVIFAGKGTSGSGYGRMARSLRNTKTAKVSEKTDKLAYSDIYRTITAPVHLLECSDEGAIQLFIMAQKDYRKRLNDIVFHAGPPPVGISSADGTIKISDSESLPLMIGVDMDVTRVGRALRQAVNAGYHMLIIACLPKQEAALKLLFGEENAKYVVIGGKNLIDTFGPLRLYEPVPGPYIDAKGEMIDAANLPVHRKMGKQAHRKAAQTQD